MKRIIRVTVSVVLATAALYTLLALTVGVSFYRPVPLDNDPLTNSVAIVSVSSNRLTLADGRVLVMPDREPDQLSWEMRNAGGRVEVDSSDSRFAVVYAKRHVFICGTGAPWIVIPLLRDEYPAYYRQAIGLGEFQ